MNTGTVGVVGTPVKTRRYESPVRAEQAARTRTAVLRAARSLFTTRGYGATSVADIARRARVSVDTVYASVGRKPDLLLAVHDMILGASDEPLPAEERDYVRAVRAAPTAEAKIRIYADALGEVLPRTVPLVLALREAGRTDSRCRTVADDLDTRRAANMRRFAGELRATGRLRDDLTDEDVADLVWSMNDAAYFELMRARGRTPQEFADVLADVWTRTLLA